MKLEPVRPIGRAIEEIRIVARQGRVAVQESYWKRWAAFLIASLCILALPLILSYVGRNGPGPDTFGQIMFGVLFGVPIAVLGLILLPWSAALVVDEDDHRISVRWRCFFFPIRTRVYSARQYGLAIGEDVDHIKSVHEIEGTAMERGLANMVVPTELFALAHLAAEKTAVRRPALVVIDRASGHTETLLMMKERRVAESALAAIQTHCPSLVELPPFEDQADTADLEL